MGTGAKQERRSVGLKSVEHEKKKHGKEIVPGHGRTMVGDGCSTADGSAGYRLRARSARGRRPVKVTSVAFVALPPNKERT